MEGTVKWLDIASVELLPGNAKDHDVGAIVASITQFGFLNPVGLNTATGHAFDGNGRLEALRRMKLSGYVGKSGAETRGPPEGVREQSNAWLAPFWCFEVPEGREQAVAVALNKTNELGGWDYDVLSTVLQNLATTPDGLVGTGFSKEDLDPIMAFRGVDMTAVPNLAGWEEPTSAFRLIVTCENEDDLLTLRAFLGLNDDLSRVTEKFKDTNVALGQE